MSMAFESIHPAHEDFLRDESRRVGQAETISFPENELQVVRVLQEAASRGLPVTVQGGRTGITAGAVPEGGHVLNLGRMTAILGVTPDPARNRVRVRVQPGLLLNSLREAITADERLADARSFFFPPDPTEPTASIGGMIACNASGARTFRYGPTRDYVEALRVALADGSLIELRRGGQKARGRLFDLGLGGGRVLSGRVPGYSMPAVKNAAGYFAADDMDLVDLFIGSEGTLGVIVEAEILLVPEPPIVWGVTAFLPDEPGALELVRRVRDAESKPAAIEFFDRRALDLLARKRDAYETLSHLPPVPPGRPTAVYVEYEGETEDEVMGMVEELSGMVTACGGDENAAWTAAEPHELDRLLEFRHAVPETVNLVIDERRRREPSLTKLGTDMAVPDGRLDEVVALYHDQLDAAGLEYVMFGHVGNNHLHVNILPNTADDYERGRAIYLEWARQVIRMGGTISAEHGVGKLKTALLKEMYGESGIEAMQAVKAVFDPERRLNRGNLF